MLAPEFLERNCRPSSNKSSIGANPIRFPPLISKSAATIFICWIRRWASRSYSFAVSRVLAWRAERGAEGTEVRSCSGQLGFYKQVWNFRSTYSVLGINSRLKIFTLDHHGELLVDGLARGHESSIQAIERYARKWDEVLDNTLAPN